MNKISRHRLLGAIALGACGLAAPAMADFNFTSFPNANGLSLVGNAAVGSNVLRLNPSLGSQKGAAWASAKQQVAGGFTSSFSFRITDKIGVGADGFAFVIQNAGNNAIGGDGGANGYATNPVFGFSGIPNSVAVEFDFFNNNGGWDDTAWAQHVSIQSRGLLENSPDTAYSLGNAAIPAVDDGAQHTVTVTYLAGTMVVRLDGNQILARQLDLGTMLSLDAGHAYVGFTASTGGALDSQSHVIEDWSFTSQIPSPGAGALAAMGGILAARRRRR